jgi:hypothetical protein
VRRFARLVLCLSLSGPFALFSQTTVVPATQPTLSRHYELGERLVYRMHGINEGHSTTRRYDALPTGRVTKDASGNFVEQFHWSDVHNDGEAFTLSPESQQLQQTVSLDPGHHLAMPNLRTVQPALIGPIADLLTFYADVQLAMRQKDFVHAGDHVFVKRSTPSSWAYGTHILLGQDVIDFDISLQSVDDAAHTALLIVRHVPPAELQLKLPAAWMLKPVDATPNNWVQVEKTGEGKYIAGVGHETFEADIKIALPSGRILSATMDNPVDVLERTCDDADLATCGEASHYGVRRQIRLDAQPN